MSAHTATVLADQSMFFQKITSTPGKLSYANVARRANSSNRKETATSEALSEVTRISSDSEVADSGTSEGEWECHSDLLSESPPPSATMTDKDGLVPAPSTPQEDADPVAQPRIPLRSKASLFVPCEALVPVMVKVVRCQPAQQALEHPVPAAIRHVFGPHLKKITTTETADSTSLQVELDYAMMDSEEEQSIHSHAMQRLMVALDGTLGHHLKDMRPSGDELSFEFFSQGTKRLCWKFVDGCCPRGRDCYWEHAVAQVFLIAIVLSPPPSQAEELVVKVVRDERGSAGYRVKSMRIVDLDPIRKDLEPLKNGHVIKAVNGIPVVKLDDYREHAVGVPEFTITVHEDESLTSLRQPLDALPDASAGSVPEHVCPEDQTLPTAPMSQFAGPTVEPKVALPPVALREEATPLAVEEAASIRSSSPASIAALSTASLPHSCLFSPAGKIRWADIEDDDDD